METFDPADHEETVADLQDAEATCSALFDVARDAVILLDNDARVSYWNKSAENMFGFSSQDAIGITLTELIIPPRFHRQHEEGFSRFRTTGEGPVIGSTIEMSSLKADGSEFPIELSLSALKLHGQWHAIGLIRDISERKKGAEDLHQADARIASLRESAERYQSLFEAAFEGIGVAEKGVILDVNPVMEEMFEYGPGELIGRQVIELVAENDRDMVKEKIISDSEYDRPFEWKGLRKDGSTFYVESLGKMLMFEGKRVRMASVRDITGRKRAEDALRSSEEKFSKAFRRSPEAIAITSLDDLKLVDVNEGFTRVSGFSREEAVGRSTDDLGIWADPQARKSFIESLRAQKEIHELETSWITKAGDQREVVISTELIELAGKPHALSVTQDITERKLAEEKLKNSENNLSRAQEVAQIGSWYLDVVNDVLTWSDQTYRMFGAPIGSPLTYSAFLDFVHPEDREYVNQKWTAALGREPYDIEHRIIVDDEVKWVHEKADLEFDDNGELLGGIGTVQDITERKKDEHALREAAEKYKVFVQESIALAWSFEYRPPMPLDLTLDEQIEWTLYKTHLVECNESFAHAYGFSSSNEALGVTVRGIFGDDEELAVKQARDWIEAGHEYHVFETFQQTRTGEYKWYLNTASSVIEDNCLTKGWGTALDVTEIKKSQEALRKRDRDIRKAYSDVFSAVTDGKLVMLTQDEILEALGKPVADEYSVPSAEKLAESRQYLREILAENLPTGADVGDLILASGETVTNGVKHAGSCDVQVFMLDGSIQIKVSDEGSGIDFSDLPKAAFMAGFSTKKSLGMGFTVILEVCDRVLLSTGKEGTTVVLEAGGEKEEESLDDILARTHVG